MRSFGVVILGMLILPSPARACTCAAPGARHLGHGTVFEGEVVRVALRDVSLWPPDADWNYDPVEVEFAVTRVWRGALPARVIVLTGLGGGDCGYDFRVASTYLVPVREDESRTLSAGICSGIQPRHEAQAMIHALGPGRRPTLSWTPAELFQDPPGAFRVLRWAYAGAAVCTFLSLLLLLRIEAEATRWWRGSRRGTMKPIVTSAVVFSVLCALPEGAVAQVDSALPDPGSYGLSFSLPSGGGAGLGFRHMRSEQRSVGVELQLGMSWQDVDGPDSPDAGGTSFGIGVSPDLRLYRRATGPVVPFVELAGDASYQRGSADNWGLGGGVGVGMGVEWIPLEGMSISGSTGIGADFRHQVTAARSSDRLSVGLSRSELTLTLYF